MKKLSKPRILARVLADETLKRVRGALSDGGFADLAAATMVVTRGGRDLTNVAGDNDGPG